MNWLRQLRDIYDGVFLAPYRRQAHREYLRAEDQFFVVAFADLLGVPHAVPFYTLELYPHLIQQFHEWHRRMGMEHPPEGGFRCC